MSDRTPKTASGEQLYRSALSKHFPGHVKTLGLIAVEIASLETRLSNLLGALLRLDDDILAGVLYFTPRAAIARIEIVESVGNLVLKNTLTCSTD